MGASLNRDVVRPCPGVLSQNRQRWAWKPPHHLKTKPENDLPRVLRHFICDSYARLDEIATFPVYYLAKPEHRKWAPDNQDAGPSSNMILLVPSYCITSCLLNVA